ncbi:MAG TPA: GNAT family N-acetyltransferase [Pseudobdellovibrionaceae bacterium]|jgi:hypothetical protein
MEIVYRKFHKETDYAEQRKLFRLSFPETEGTPTITDAHFNWKFESYPANKAKTPSYQYVALDEEIVGYYAALPYQYKIGDNIMTCGMVCDVMTHPQRRGRGIFTSIGHHATNDLKEKGVSFTTGYPIRPEVIPGHLKVGWKVTLKLPMYLRPLRLKSFLPKKVQFLSGIVSPFISLIQFFALLPKKYFTYDILNKSDFLKLAEYDGFFNDWLKNQSNALIKSKSFLNWRTSAPGTEYQFVILRHKEKLAGLALARGVNLKGIESLAVLDIMILPEFYRGARVLHQGLRKLALQLQKDVVVCMASSYWTRNYKLRTSFYLPTPAIFSLIVKKLDLSIPDRNLFSPDNWHLFWVDSDDL